jgi:putative transposase
MLPHDFPAWQTVYSYYRRWAESGVLAQIEAVLKRKLRPRAGEDE